MDTTGHRHWQAERDADDIVWLTLDQAGSAVNTLAVDVVAELDRQLVALEKEPPRGLIIRSGKASGFIAGADIKEFLRAGTPEWPGDTPYSCGWTWSIAEGATVNVSALTMSPHVGTHADAPLHVHDGWPASDALPLDAFVGPSVVLDVRDAGATLEIEALDAAAARAGLSIARVERLLLRLPARDQCRIGHTGERALPILLLLGAKDVRRTLVAREQVASIFRIEERPERLDAADDEEEVVLPFQREHNVDEIMPRTGVAKVDLQTISEEA